MKKILTVVALIAVLLLACGCGEVTYDELQQMANKTYGTVRIEGTVTAQNDDELKFSAVVTTDGDNQEVLYSYDQYSTFTEVDGQLVVPEQKIETKKGTITRKDGKTVEQSGDEITSENLESVISFGFLFKAEMFANAQFPANGFRAQVVNPSLFLGVDDFKGTDMTIALSYGGSSLKGLELTYSLDGAQVSVNFLFN